MTETTPTRCVSAVETRQHYLELIASKVCGKGNPCLRDHCEHCGPVLELIDKRALECDARGCSIVNGCVYD